MARWPVSGAEGALVEDVGHEAHVLDDGDVDAVGHRHAGRLLPAVLQGVQAEVGEVGDRLVRGVHTEDATRLFQRVVGGRRSDEVAVGGLGHRPMIARSGPTSTNPPGMPAHRAPSATARGARWRSRARLCTIRPWASTRWGAFHAPVPRRSRAGGTSRGHRRMSGDRGTPTKVVLVSDSFHPWVGGGERQMQLTLARLDPARWVHHRRHPAARRRARHLRRRRAARAARSAPRRRAALAWCATSSAQHGRWCASGPTSSSPSRSGSSALAATAGARPARRARPLVVRLVGG